MTLAELKEQNAAKELEAAKPPQAEAEEEEIVADEVATDEPGKVAEPGGEDDTIESEPWMLSDEQTSQEEGGEKAFTGSDIAAAKRKLRAKLEKSNDEVADLRAEIEKLKTQRLAPAASHDSHQAIKRPMLNDFDTTDEYGEALDEYIEAKTLATVQKATNGQAQTAQQEQAKEAFTAAVDQHYERAATLAEKYGITAEVYQQADLAVRTAIEQIMPNQGDLVTDQLINSIGEGSEKVMLYVGRNKGKTAQLQQALLSDPTGMKAVAFLGRMSGEVTAPKKRNSQAPKPATQLKGGSAVPVSAEAKALRKTYQAAKGNPQARYDARKAARKAGLDPSDW